MTVASTLNKKQYQGNSLTTEFPLPFHVTAKEHIFALLKKGTKIEQIQNNFAVDLERKVFIYPVQGEAIKDGESLTIYRKIPLTQIVDLENAGAFHPEVLEHDGFDRIVMQIQQIDEEIGRALKIDITDTRDVTNLIEELFKAREEAVFYAQKALEQAELAADKAEKTQNWALFAEEKVQELTDLQVECFISNDGQGQVTYDKEVHKLEIVLPFDNAGLNQPKVVLTDSFDLARSDIGASAKAVQSLQTKICQDMTAALAEKIDKTAICDSMTSDSSVTVASSKAVNDLRLKVPELAMPSDNYITIPLEYNSANNHFYKEDYIAPANGYIYLLSNPAVSKTNTMNINDKTNDINIILRDNHAGYEFSIYLPVKKGHEITLGSWGAQKLTARFYYAEGEL